MTGDVLNIEEKALQNDFFRDVLWSSRSWPPQVDIRASPPGSRSQRAVGQLTGRGTGGASQTLPSDAEQR